MQMMPTQPKTKLGDGNQSLHHTTKSILGFEKKSFLNEQGFVVSLEKAISDPDDKAFKANVISSYSSLYKHHQDLINEEALINRMERKAQVRNTLFRGITTLTIGFSIMAVYWVASALGIAMPLMRVPL